MTAPALDTLSAEEKRRLLARLLAERNAGKAGPADAADRPAAGPRRLPLSYAQHRLWFLDQLDPGSAAFNISSAVRLSGELDAEALTAALDDLTARHETLRTAILTVEGRGLQEVHPSGRAPLERVDLTGLPEARRAAAAGELAARDARRPFELADPPLWRVTLAVLGREEHVLVLTMHHIVSDGLSMEVLTGELVELYRARREGRPSPLPERPLQYADYALWQRRAVEGEGRLADQLAYWRERLAGVDPYLALPDARARGGGADEGASDRGRRQSRRLGAERLAGLRKLAHAEGTTLFVVVLAAFQAAVGGLAGRDDFLIGAPFAGRNRTELEGMIGFLLNLVPLRADLSGEPSLRELVARARGITLEAQENQDLPFDAMVDELGLPRSLDHSPLVQITCDVQTAPAPVAARAGRLTVRPLVGGAAEASELAQFDLSLNAMVYDDRMPIHLTHRADLYGDAVVSRLFDRLEGTLTAMASRPEVRLGALGAELAEIEREREDRRESEALAARSQKFAKLRRRSAAVERSDR